MTTSAAPECMACRHLDRSPDATVNRCTAFPDGIPLPLLRAERLHRSPYAGDHGVRFERAESAPSPRP